jgi:hypothetical protein
MARWTSTLQAGERDVSSEAISIKGIRHGLLVTLHDGGWDVLYSELERRIEANPSFFKGGRVSLDVGAVVVREDDLRTARDLLGQHDVVLHAVVSENEETESAAQALGLVIGGRCQSPRSCPPICQKAKPPLCSVRCDLVKALSTGVTLSLSAT